MAAVKRIKAGQYIVSDGRNIVKDSGGWYVLDSKGNVELGNLPTLSSAKEYVTNGVTSLGNHGSSASSYSKSQRKKEFNAYLTTEARNGNYLPVILWFVVLIALAVLFEFAKK